MTVTSRATRRIATLVASVTLPLAGLALTAPAAMADDTLTVASTSTTHIAADGTTQLAGLSVGGEADSTVVSVTVSTDIGAIAVADTADVDLAYGNHWSGDASVTFSGTIADVNQALASVSITEDSSASGTPHISIHAMPYASGMVYSPTNGHYYQYVADPTKNITWSQAEAAAKTKTFLGQTGYLATIPDSAVNDLVTSKIPGALNVWIGGESTDTPDGDEVKRTWTWVDGPLAGTPFTECSNWTDSCSVVDVGSAYSNWASGEPNNAQASVGSAAHSGEWVVVTNWGSASGLWNDLPDGDVDAGGYVVEYGDEVSGSTGFTGVADADSAVQIVHLASAPSGAWATAGDSSATVSFVAPSSAGDSPITGYTVTSSPGGITKTCSGSPCTVTGLTNGTDYTFTVHANSAYGAGAESDPSNDVTPAAAPSAVRNLTATASSHQIDLSFDAPASNGGADIDHYEYSFNGTDWVPLEAQRWNSPITATLSDLTNGTTYSVRVRAVNSVGDGATATASPVMPVSVPDRPENPQIAATGDGSLTVTFQAPMDDGGQPILSYTVTTWPDMVTKTCASSPCTVTGLRNGIPYSATVVATNSVGDSIPSNSTDLGWPSTTPGAPLDLTVTPAEGELDLSFNAPVVDGGKPVSGYEYSINGGLSWDTLWPTSWNGPITAAITGLTDGTAYTVMVRAVNYNGSGAAATAAAATPGVLPDAPGNVDATAGDGSATVTFDAPSDPSITSYTVTSSPGGITKTCSGSPCVITGLTDGTSYRFTVHSTNATGSGAESNESAAVTPTGLPGAPRNVSATASDGQVTVTFDTPASDGGSPIDHYTVVSSSGDQKDCSGSPCTLNGLVNGHPYTFTVYATNGVGAGPSSAGTASVTPGTVPGQPQNLVSTAGNQSMTVSFDPPTDTGGFDITSYTVTVSPGNITQQCSSPCTITGLTNGVMYYATVHATNAIGDGQDTVVTAAKPITVPTAVRDLTVTPGDQVLHLSFDPPASDGGAGISGYEYSLDGWSWNNVYVLSGGSPVTSTIYGVDNGTAYTVRVRAFNDAGHSDEVSASATPGTAPGIPTNVVATPGAGSASVSFDAPSDNGGSAITSYTVTSSPDGVTKTCSSSPCVVTGLTSGTSYTFTVHATNAAGSSDESDPSEAVTPLSVPTAPGNVSVSRSGSTATVTFDAPSSNGGSAVTGYTLNLSPGGSISCGASPCDVTGLVAGTDYTVTVAAVNGNGTGVASSAVDIPDVFSLVPVPTVSGTAQVGETLTADAGAWSPTPDSVTYQWYADGVAITGATGSTLTLAAAQAGKAITVVATGHKSGYVDTASDHSTATADVLSVFATTPTPTISGTATVGQTLTADAGTWSPAASISYQWYADGVAISGATGSTLTLTADQAGKAITVGTTGSKAGYADAAKTSAATAAVTNVFATAPVPTISGTAMFGQTLTAHPGTWSPTASIAYQWYADGVAISGATGSTLALGSGQIGKNITVTTTGSASGYEDVTKTSVATTAVAAAAFATAPVPTISGTVQVGETLTADAGAWSPTPTSLTYQWYADGVAILGATGSTYTLTAAQAGKAITVETDGSRTGYTDLARTSVATAEVLGAFTTAPVPTISGTATVGHTLTASAGTWSPTPDSVTYQWYAGGVAIEGATGSTYALTSDEVGKAITVTMTGESAGFAPVTKTSAETDDVTDVFATVPAPTVTGTARVGETLTAHAGTWSPTPTSVAYQWYADGVAIDGANSSTYELTADQAGSAITVTVTGAARGYESATSDHSTPTGDVVDVFTDAPAPTISGVAAVGQTLTADAGDWSPTPDSIGFQWYADGEAISGATDSSFDVTAAQKGSVITVRATATRSGFQTVVKTSDGTDEVASAAFADTPAPTISGDAIVGHTLTADAGDWSPAADISYQWYADGVAIDGATGPTFGVTAGQAGKAITVRTTGAKDGYATVTETSDPTGDVQSVFTSTGTATITGDAVKGSTLTVHPGSWTPSQGVTFSYQWYADGAAINGATNGAFAPTGDQVGKAITVVATAHKAGYVDASSSASSATAKVLDTFDTTPTPAVTGVAAVGETLTADPGSWSQGAQLSYQWYADGVAISGATDPTFTIGHRQAGKTITVTVTGARDGYASVSQTSTATAQVAAGSWAMTRRTRMTGSSALNGTLTATDPVTTKPADSYTYQWYAAGRAIRGATGRSIVVKPYPGKRMSVKVTALKAGYPDIVSMTRGSHPVGTFWRNKAPQITGTVAVGSTVTAVVDVSAWAPTPTSFTYSWWIDGKPVKGATKSTYRIPARYKGHQLAVHVTARRVGYPLQTERFSPRQTIR